MKIAIVNDAVEAIQSLQRIIARDASLNICWVAVNGKEAVEHCIVNPPDLILMDLFMPVMNGVEATRQIMKNSPCRILIVTADVTKNAAKIFEAMGVGAIDVVTVSGINRSKKSGEALLKKINTIGRLTGVRTDPLSCQQINCGDDKKVETQMKLVAIGCSTGGPLAVLEILSTFPAGYPAAFVLVQHMDQRFTDGLAEWLDQQIDLEVRILKENDQLQKGVVLVSSAESHVVLKGRGRIGYLKETAVRGYYVPSVDIFFRSVAEIWPGKSIGVLLTGMGRDGAEGLLAMRKKGMNTITQNKETCVVFGMPKAAIELGAVQSVLPLEQIGAKINAIIEYED